MVVSAGTWVESDLGCRCPWLSLLVHLQPLHKGLVSFGVSWGPMRPLDTRGCVFPVCPGHICLSKEYLLPLGSLKDAVSLGSLGGKGQALALRCSWVIENELPTCSSVSP